MSASLPSHAPAHRGQSRRQFLNQAVLGLTSVALASPLPLISGAAEEVTPPPRKTVVGSNVYGWGQYAQREGKSLDLDAVLSALRDTGYDYLESYLDVAHPQENGRFADQLKAGSATR